MPRLTRHPRWDPAAEISDMSDVILPPGLSIARNRFSVSDSTGISRSPMVA